MVTKRVSDSFIQGPGPWHSSAPWLTLGVIF